MLMGVARKLCMMYGLAQTSPIDGSIIGTTTPLLVLILSVVVGIDRFTIMKVLGLLLGMAATFSIILSSGGNVHEHSSVWGNMLIFISSCVSAFYMVLCKRLVGKYRVTTVLRWIYCVSAFVMLPIGIDDMLTIDFLGMDTKILLASLFVLIVPTYLPNLLLNYSLRSVPPTASSIYAYIQPVVAVGLSVAMKLDKLHPDTLLFAVIIFVGVAMVVGSYRQSLHTK